MSFEPVWESRSPLNVVPWVGFVSTKFAPIFG